MIPKQPPAMNEVTNFRGEVVTEADTDAAAGEAFIALVGDRSVDAAHLSDGQACGAGRGDRDGRDELQ